MERNNLGNRLRLNQACTDQNTPQYTWLNPDKIQNNVWVESKHSILYCDIPKVGSTFWTRALTVLASDRNFTSPFQLKRGNLIQFVDFKKSLNEEMLRDFLDGVNSFMFVRDPYSRLFSGYEHKLYYPNLIFWSSYGVPIVKSVRKNPSNESLQYGHDVKFSEFVSYILKQKENKEKINVHFKPMNERCDPCRLPYDYIGHLETFKQDAEYLFDKWKQTFSDIDLHFDNFEKETVLDTAQSLIGRLFKSWDEIKNSINYPFYNLVLRVWSDLQIRGYLSKDIPLPFKPEDVNHLTPQRMLQAVSDALQIKVNHTAVKLQRREALRQIFETVPLEDMERLRNFVLKDCQLFGYDDRPPLLFDRNHNGSAEYQYMKGI